MSGRYSKVSRRIWHDEKFRHISQDAKFVFLRLLTAPEMTPMAGVIQAWEQGLAESLRWPVKAFREAFGEAFRVGLVRADWKAGLVWLPNAIRYNKPESPNVVRAWKNPWEDLPECALKHEIYEAHKAFLEALGEGFAKAFAENCRKPSGKPCPNQEQEQEQEQEQDLNPHSLRECPPLPGETRKPKRAAKPKREKTHLPSPDDEDAVDAFLAKWPEIPSPEGGAESEAFFDHHLAKDSAFRDWHAAWRNWLRYRAKFGTNGKLTQPASAPASQTVLGHAHSRAVTGPRTNDRGGLATRVASGISGAPAPLSGLLMKVGPS